MARVYLQIGDDGYVPSNYLKVLATPFSLLNSDDEFAIEGINFLMRGTPEWEKYESDFRKILEDWIKRKIRTQKEVEEIMVKRSTEDRVSSSPFYALHFATSFPKFYRKRLIGDQELKILGEISPDAKRIDFFHSEMPVDMVKKAGWQQGYRYDGALGDVLGDFQKEGFYFNLFDCTWNAWNIEDGKQSEYMQEAKRIEGAKLEDVLRFSKVYV